MKVKTAGFKARSGVKSGVDAGDYQQLFVQQCWFGSPDSVAHLEYPYQNVPGGQCGQPYQNVCFAYDNNGRPTAMTYCQKQY